MAGKKQILGFKRKGPHFWGFWIAILATFLTVIIYLAGPDIVDLMEMKTYDLRFHARGIKQPDSRIVIAAIDQESIDRLGRWPWPRSIQAELLDRLSRAGASVIGYDVTFPSPDRNSELMRVREFLRNYESLGLNRSGEKGLSFYQGMRDVEREADTDLALEKALRRAGNVVLGLFFFLSKKEAGDLGPESLARDRAIIAPYKFSLVQRTHPSVASPSVTKAFGVEPNLERFTRAAHTSGFFNMNSDPDGVIRWETMILDFEGDYYPSLDLQVTRSYLGLEQGDMAVQISPYGVEGVFLGDRAIPTDERGRMLVNYHGPERTYPYYSAVKILDGSISPETFSEKIVLIGVTAIGIYDMRFTPFGQTAGIEVHAQSIDNILNRDFMIRPDWLAIFDLFIIILIGTFLGLLLPRMRPFFTLLLCIAVGGVYLFFNQYFFNSQGLWLSLVYPLIEIGMVFSAVTVFRYATEEREKRKIKTSFSHYLAPDLVNALTRNPELLRLGGEKRFLTCLFTDIRGFTSISERMEPEKLVTLLQEYMTAMTDIILNYNGLLDKYIGDAIMAVFCTPIAEPDHALRACLSSLDMRHALKGLNDHWQSMSFPEIDIGVGINTGEMVVGNMGSTSRFDYTVIGDNVNLASRLEGTNKHYGTQIIISQYTWEQVKDEVLARELDAVRVQGKKEPVLIYELLARDGSGEEQDNTKTLIRLFDEARILYKARDWNGAEAAFFKVLEFMPDDFPAKVYLERCRQLSFNPPPTDWDGVFSMTKK